MPFSETDLLRPANDTGAMGRHLHSSVLSQSQASVVLVDDTYDDDDSMLSALAAALPWAISIVLHVGLAFVLFMVFVLVTSSIMPAASNDELPVQTGLFDHAGVSNPGAAFVDLPTAQERYNVPDAAGYSQQQSDGQSIYEGVSNDGRGRGVGPSGTGGYGTGAGDGRIIGAGGGGGSAGGGGPLAPWGPSGGNGRPGGIFQPSKLSRIVYLVDRSGSMLETFDYVRDDMKQIIGGMSVAQSFHVVFFSDGEPIENPPRMLVNATADAKRQAADFLDGIVPAGATNPSKAIRRAFAARDADGQGPALIYVLTDGSFDEENVRLIRSLNSRNEVRVNTISFITREGDALLEKLAQQNGGKHRFVAITDLGH